MSFERKQSQQADNSSLVGLLALIHLGKRLPLQVLHSAAGYYIGTFDDVPVSRESVEYFQDRRTALRALRIGMWTQRQEP